MNWIKSDGTAKLGDIFIFMHNMNIYLILTGCGITARFVSDTCLFTASTQTHHILTWKKAKALRQLSIAFMEKKCDKKKRQIPSILILESLASGIRQYIICGHMRCALYQLHISINVELYSNVKIDINYGYFRYIFL